MIGVRSQHLTQIFLLAVDFTTTSLASIILLYLRERRFGENLMILRVIQQKFRINFPSAKKL